MMFYEIRYVIVFFWSLKKKLPKSSDVTYSLEFGSVFVTNQGNTKALSSYVYLVSKR